jgi:hypothetical protein
MRKARDGPGPFAFRLLLTTEIGVAFAAASRNSNDHE